MTSHSQEEDPNKPTPLLPNQIIDHSSRITENYQRELERSDQKIAELQCQIGNQEQEIRKEKAGSTRLQKDVVRGLY